MKFSGGLFAILFVVGLAACGGESAPVDVPDAEAGGGGGGADAQPSAPDAAPLDSPDADVALGGATLTGTITRSAQPAAGGIGNLYIAVFTLDPVSNADTTVNVANARIENADMSADDAMVTYTMLGVPPRAEPYYVTAFLDDNGTVDTTDPANAGPDRGDLVAIDGFASPQVSITSETTVTLDLDLNFNLPF